MKVLFFAENPNLFIEFASRLEANNIPFWTVNNFNDFHCMVSQMTVDVVFIDFNLINFTTFDVYSHIKDKGGDIVLLFLNQPSDVKSLFVQWEDSILKTYPEKWTNELESLLRIVADQPMGDFSSFSSSKVQDLIEQIKNDQELYNEQIEENASFFLAEKPSKKQAYLPQLLHSVNKETHVNTKLIEDFYKVKQLQKLSFSEFLILDLLKRRKTDFVTIEDMIQTLEISHEEKNVKKIYKYIHNIRRYLEKQNSEKCSLVRIKKSVYSLVFNDRD